MITSLHRNPIESVIHGKHPAATKTADRIVSQLHYGHIDPEFRGKHFPLLVKVPHGAISMHLKLRYSDRVMVDSSAEGNALDLSLTDARALSVSGCDELFIGEQSAKTRAVQIGVHKILPAGCDFELIVTFHVRATTSA